MSLVSFLPFRREHQLEAETARDAATARDARDRLRWIFEKWEQELRLRDARNRLIRELLNEGRSVFYRSSGSSMWPLVQADDGCWFRPHPGCNSEGWGALDPEGGLRD